MGLPKLLLLSGTSSGVACASEAAAAAPPAIAMPCRRKLRRASDGRPDSLSATGRDGARDRSISGGVDFVAMKASSLGGMRVRARSRGYDPCAADSWYLPIPVLKPS